MLYESTLRPSLCGISRAGTAAPAVPSVPVGFGARSDAVGTLDACETGSGGGVRGSGFVIAGGVVAAADAAGLRARADHSQPPATAAPSNEIGRASCRERVK